VQRKNINENKMTKKATTVDQQIEILRERGMNFDMEIEKVKEILLDIGYYRLGFYWNPFEIDPNHNFISGTKFSDVVALYYLDFDLRRLLTNYLNRIEINFRTKLVYLMSNQYPNTPTWFISSHIVSASYIRDFDIIVYNQKFINNNKPIKKHHQKYINDRYAPAWKTIEFFTFGNIFTLYNSLILEADKKCIVKEYDINRLDTFVKLVSVLVFARNSCAHGTALFDINLPKSLPKMVFMNITQNYNNLDSMIKIIRYFIGIISKNRMQDFDKEIDDIIEKNKLNPIIKNIIEKKMGIV
jgi:abortive infection bacteriophage resistance protein